MKSKSSTVSNSENVKFSMSDRVSSDGAWRRRLAVLFITASIASVICGYLMNMDGGFVSRQVLQSFAVGRNVVLKMVADSNFRRHVGSMIWKMGFGVVSS